MATGCWRAFLYNYKNRGPFPPGKLNFHHKTSWPQTKSRPSITWSSATMLFRRKCCHHGAAQFNRSLCSDRSQIEFPIISRSTILTLLIYAYIKNNSPTTFLGFDVTAKGFYYELTSSDGSYLHEMLMRIWVIIAKQGKDYKMMMQLCSIVNKWYSLVRSKWPIASFVALLHYLHRYAI